MTARRVLAWAGSASLALAAAVAALMLVPALLGLQRYVITGDSMSGTYDRGSIIFSEVVEVGELRVGDVITYDPPRASGWDGLITHRIVSIDASRPGRAVLRTKGDANDSRDPWRFVLAGERQARAVASVPWVGYAFALLGVREVRMALIGIPALAVAAGLLAGLWRDSGREAGRCAH